MGLGSRGWLIALALGLALSAPLGGENNETAIAADGVAAQRVGWDGRILIAVVSAPGHEDARIAIRNSWARLTDAQKQRVDVRFFVGNMREDLPDYADIQAMLARSDDVVHLNTFTEAYHNLTAKAKGIFHWAHTNDYATLMKVDDDTFVRIDKLLEYVDSIPDLANVYAGHINRPEYGETDVHKNADSKWYMYDQYPHEHFPAFADGPGMLLGSNALKFLSENRDSLFDYRCDDAAVAIWTDKLQLEKRDMKCSIYEFSCSSADVFVNPVSAGEMYILKNYHSICESGYTLEVCLDKPCLCKGHPERAKCWQEIIDEPYHDIIPR